MTAPSTKHIYLHGLAGSLVNLGVVSLYSLLVIRLSLDYLDKEAFGLMSLSSQISLYIGVLDLGLFTAFSRILIDYSNQSREAYANALRTAALVFRTIGGIAAGLGLLVAVFGGGFLVIPAGLHSEFRLLMVGHAAMLLGGFLTKPCSAPLIAVGRHYYIYWLASALTPVNCLVFWGCLRGGVGIYSALIGNFLILCLTFLAIHRLSAPFRDVGKRRGEFDKRIFKDVASFARDSMLWQIGGQTLGFLPVLLASMWFTLGATADLSGGMKLMLLMLSVCTRFGDMAVTPLSIRFSQGETLLAASQMLRIARIAGSVGVCAAVVLICCNPPFISWWMLGKIEWSWKSNLAGAVWVALTSVTQCMFGYAVVSRQMNLFRWAPIAECGLYILLVASLEPLVGFPILLWSLVAAKVAVSFVVALRLQRHTDLKAFRLLGIVGEMFLALVVLAPCCLFIVSFLPQVAVSPMTQLAVAAFGALAIAALAFLFLMSRDDRVALSGLVRGLVARFHST